MIKNLSIDFDSKNFENASLQKFYAGLQALALDEDEPEPVEDLLEPDYEGMKALQPVIDKFKNTFFDGGDNNYDFQAKKPANGSRSAANKAASKPKKVEVIETIVFDDSEDSEDEPIIPKKRNTKARSSSR